MQTTNHTDCHAHHVHAKTYTVQGSKMYSQCSYTNKIMYQLVHKFKKLLKLPKVPMFTFLCRVSVHEEEFTSLRCCGENRTNSSVYEVTRLAATSTEKAGKWHLLTDDPVAIYFTFCIVCLRQQPMDVMSSQQLWKQQHFTSQQQPDSVLQLSPVQHPLQPAAAQPVAWCLAGPLLAWSSWFCTSLASSLPQPPHPAEFEKKKKKRPERSQASNQFCNIKMLSTQKAPCCTVQ